ncbi:MAG TPA: YhcH/YjgK/YiaL family protein [Terriglobia bacterium]|nr:YhcH/YjgK/YiaL family protein [Terriglobia bacterium]
MDDITNEERWRKLHPGFAAAFRFLRETKLDQLPDGRQEIDGSRLYALVVRGQGHGQEMAKMEAHRRYIDIQYSATAPDVVGWKQISTCRNPVGPYSEKKDIQFFLDAADSWVTVPQGSFAIFFPEDAHAPMAVDGPIHKVVVKVAVDWQ